MAINHKVKILKASAGTGKTYRLSLEYIAALINGIDYRNIVVMTFTKKATAEIKERIFLFLKDILDNTDNGKELISNICDIYNIKHNNISIDKLQKTYKDMLLNKNDVRIYTIDGFINNIFSKSIVPYLSLYNFRVINNNSNEIIEDILIELIKRDKINSLINITKEYKNIDIYKTYIAHILNNRYILSQPVKKNIRYSDLGIFSDSTSFINNYKKYIDNINGLIEYFIKCCNEVKKYPKNIGISSKFDFLINQEPNEENAMKLFKILLNGKYLPLKLGRTTIEEKESIIESGTDYSNEFLNSSIPYIYDKYVLDNSDILVQFANDVLAIDEEIKKKNKVFTFNDITSLTLENIKKQELAFIKNNAATDTLLDIIGGNIDYIMIDEFQDTSIEQWKLLSYFIKSAKYITCVGDEKQSIYGWRGGDKKLFENLENLMQNLLENADINVETLNTSYRSSPLIVDNINKLFKLTEEKGIVEVKSAKKYTEGKDFFHTVYVNKSNEFRNIIIEQIITKSLENNVTVICRKNSDLIKLESELSKNNIKYSVNNKASIFDVEIVSQIYHLIKYCLLDNNISLIHFLRGDIEFLTLNELKNILEDIKNINKIENPSIKRILEFKKILLNYNTVSSEMQNLFYSFARIFKVDKKLFDTTNMINVFELFRIIQSYDTILEFIEDVEKSNNNNKLNGSIDNKFNKKTVTANNSVELTTIHKSKGLEYNNVIFYYSATRARADALNIFYSYNEKYKLDSLILSQYNDIRILSHVNIDNINKKYEQYLSRLDQEEINNLYVALTRAKHGVIFLNQNPIEIKEGSYIPLKIHEEAAPVIDEKILNTFTDTNYNINNKKDNKIKSIEQEMNRKIGLAAHFYLEHIIYNTEKEHEHAISHFNKKYSNLLSTIEREKILTKIYDFIDNNILIYSTNNEVYNELVIYDNEGKKNIIDKLTKNDETKTMNIYDYKTSFTEISKKKYEKQIKHYCDIIKEKYPDYTVKGLLLKI